MWEIMNANSLPASHKFVFIFPGDASFSWEFPLDMHIAHMKEDLWKLKDTVPAIAGLKSHEHYCLKFVGPEGVMVELFDEIEQLYERRRKF